MVVGALLGPEGTGRVGCWLLGGGVVGARMCLRVVMLVVGGRVVRLSWLDECWTGSHRTVPVSLLVGAGGLLLLRGVVGALLVVGWG